MPLSCSLNPSKILLALLFIAGSAAVSAAPHVIPQQQAAHFCQLLVAQNAQTTGLGNQTLSVATLSLRARQTIQPSDSLSVEQILAGYVLLADGWQTLRLFPHHNGQHVSWYSATDPLPSSMSSEHQRYIHEVFPRLIAEVQAGNWSTVDAYIDRMIQYQCQFGASKQPSPHSSTTIIGIIFMLLFGFLPSFSYFCRKIAKLRLSCISQESSSPLPHS